MTTATDRFALARRNEPQLNRRQRDILDLLVADKTNGEIGDTLGMTLDGAKWNVSEILGKLGLESREQAAEYWRWRARPASKVTALRGLLGLGALKWVGGAAAVAVVGVLLVGLLAREDEKANGELPPFYLEARIEITDRSRSIGTNIAAGDARFEEERTMTLKWWNEDREHTRWEVESAGEFETERNIIVADGDSQWYYNAEEATYQRQSLTPIPDGFRTRPFPTSVLVGPVHTYTAAEFLKQMKGWGGDGAKMQRVGTETVLGRETVIYEFSPAYRGSSSESGPNGEMIEVDTSSGSSRIWLDEERVVVMRYTIASEVSDLYAEVTRFDYDVDIDRDRFTFKPPAGAVESDGADDDSSTTASSGQRGMLVDYSVPSGFFEAGDEAGAWLPYTWAREQDSAGKVRSFTLGLAQDLGPSEVTVVQRLAPNGLPAVSMEGELIDVAGIDAWVAHRGNAIRLVMWRDGLAITVTGFQAPEADLLAIAESLERVP